MTRRVRRTTPLLELISAPLSAVVGAAATVLLKRRPSALERAESHERSAAAARRSAESSTSLDDKRALREAAEAYEAAARYSHVKGADTANRRLPSVFVVRTYAGCAASIVVTGIVTNAAWHLPTAMLVTMVAFLPASLAIREWQDVRLRTRTVDER